MRQCYAYCISALVSGQLFMEQSSKTLFFVSSSSSPNHGYRQSISLLPPAKLWRHHFLDCFRTVVLPQRLECEMCSARVLIANLKLKLKSDIDDVYREKLSQELKSRTKELNFLRENCLQPPESTIESTHSKEEEGFRLEVREIENADSTENFVVGKEEEKVEKLHVIKSFGELLNYELIEDDHGEALFQRPRIRQYFIGDKLYRENYERKVTWDELFLDLVYVGVIAKIGATLKGDLSILKLEQFCLLFIPLWANWVEFNFYNNVLGGSDLFHRFLMLTVVALVSGMGINVKHAFDSDPATNTSNVYIASFLLCRLLIGLVSVLRAVYHPKFRHSIVIIQWFKLAESVPWFLSLFLSRDYQLRLWWASTILDLLSALQSTILVRFGIKLKYRLALNIEHFTERFGLLTIIVIGEMVVSILFDSDAPYVSSGYIATVFGLIHAVTDFWLYFNVDASRTYIHAIRRSTITSVLNSTVHALLHLAIVASGIATGKLVSAASVSLTDNSVATKSANSTLVKSELRQLYAFGNALCFICYIIMGLLHKSRDDSMPIENQPRIKKSYRLIWRFLIVIACIIVGFVGTELSPMELLSVGSALGIVTIVLEQYGGLPKGQLCQIGMHQHKE
ncbi:bacterial low temperature requirement A protein-domain-containing protein [Paraphysoderma sedebokerense]|nr:bacterial low temperature requirement A protein-domain-containing protein [Paraphysoderma sedebokerense]